MAFDEASLHEKIAARAYQIYEERLRSGQPGSDLTDWLAARSSVMKDEDPPVKITVLSEEFDYSESRVYGNPRDEYETRQLAGQELAEEDARAFFRILGGGERPDEPTKRFNEGVRAMPYPKALAPYLAEALTDENLNKHILDVVVSIPIINSRTSGRELFGGGGEWAWAHYFAAAFGSICAAGGVKIIVELLKTWVQERAGRKIRIKRGDFEIEIQGGVSPAQVDQVVKLLEEKLEKPAIIRP